MISRYALYLSILLWFSVSSTFGSMPRRDSWDAIAKTKSLLSYGSLESLANLTNDSSFKDHNLDGSRVTDYKSSYRTETIKDTTTTYSTLQKYSSWDYNLSEKRTDSDSLSKSQSPGILKNKSNNYYYKSADTIDSVQGRYHNGSSSRLSSGLKANLVYGSALETLPVRKPVSFSLDPSVDSSQVEVIVRGDHKFSFFCEFYSCVL